MTRRQGVKGGPGGGRVRAGVGAFLALGVVGAPSAQADGLDWLADLFDPSGWESPQWDSANWWDGLDFSWAEASAGPALGEVVTGFDQWLVGAVHDAGQSALTDPFVGQFITSINEPFVYLFGRVLVGDGIDGFTGTNDSVFGSSGAFGDLGDGGFLFGDGGTGATGADGGNAGWIGNGGDGGDGLDSTDIDAAAWQRRQRRARRLAFG